MLERIGFPLVHWKSTSSIRFFGDRPVVRVTCFKLGKSSLGLRYVFTVDDKVCVDARMTTVCTHVQEMKSFPLPAEYRAKFEAILEPL